MSGILGQIVGEVLGSRQVGQPSALAGILQQVLGAGQGSSGGLGALISRFESAGLGQHAQSWVSTGPNMPITGDQVSQAFSQNEINDWARQAGTTPETMREVLAQALPRVVDHLTPGGQVPAQTPDLSGLLSSFFSGSTRTR